MIFSSPHPAVTIPNLPLTEFILRTTTRMGSKPALIDGTSGSAISYDQLQPLIRQVAAGLANHGLRQGDTLAIYAPNLPLYAVIFHAAATLGSVVTMVPPLFTEEETIAQLKDSRARFLFTIPQLTARARAVARQTGVEKLFVIGESNGAISLKALLEFGDALPRIEIEPATDLAALPYSSGTTGFPKGVMLTHLNLVSMLCQMSVNQAFAAHDTLVCVVPMYHLYGLHIVVNLGLSEGATIVTLPRFDLTEFLETLEKYRVSVAPLVPPIVLALSRAPEVDNYDLSSLKLIHCGAASLADDVARACASRLNCEIRYGYGLTEVSPLSHASIAGKPHRPGSVGYCLPNTECKIVDPESGAELGPDHDGEIWLRGPQVMKGYLGNPEATREMLNGAGWLRTGDVGHVDADGQLYVVDRLKELIKYKGRQVAPAELEAVLLAHPAVADAAVIPLPDEEAGEVPLAFVVLKGEVTAAELQAYVAERVSPHKRIRAVKFVNEIPKNAAGKILRRLLVLSGADERQR